MNLEHLLTEENRQTIREFTQEEIIPIAKKLEADYSVVEEVHQKLVDMGIQASGYPEIYGGGSGPSMTSGFIMDEELAKGDAGIALTVSLNSRAVLSATAMVGNKVVMDRFAPLLCQDKLAYACLSMTDEAGGADTENPLIIEIKL